MSAGMIDWLAERAALTPKRVAVTDPQTGEAWSYGQLEQRASRIASYLSGQGIGKGDRVALLAPNDLCYFDVLFACIKLGAIFVPLNWRLSLEELQQIVTDCTPKLLLFHKRQEHTGSALSIANKLAVHSEVYHCALGTGPELSQAETTAVITDACMILYTGGTTGRTKGVVLSHQAVIWNCLNTIVSWQLSADDVTPTFLPMFHTGGLNSLCLPVLAIGGRVVIAREFQPEQAIHLLEREGCTIALMVPTMYHLVIGSPSFAAVQLPSMRSFLSGGAPCPHAIYEAFARKGLPFKEGYGLTEAGPNNFYIDPREAAVKRGSVGKPMWFNQVKLVTENGRDAEPGETGELLIAGPHLFSGYWRQPEATGEVWVDGWLRTGDLARRDEQGDYFIVGRKKEMIISGGENVYPQEVEQRLLEHPDVQEAVVVGMPDEKWGERVTAVIVPSAADLLTADQVQTFCAAKLGGYKVPKQVVFVDKLPQTGVGKLDKKRIRQLLAEA
ncbi:AMP-binding protein [Brevibacillus humidisoli]|uniref:class I adenylate-forming enzyme family protein n=1 Tax=Brevibacillus humidisoli TaxID=2895522 RepID=UPI001E58E45B|nr:AMP-binding protein [Brevibacillus humidisoli]UFJ42548.1 AMP-binding protein [Brevibacillus humidisoli]